MQSTGWAKTAARSSSLIPHTVLIMPLRAKRCILVVQQHWQKVVCESRLGHLWPSTWCFWVVHECNFHIQAKSGFQLMCGDGLLTLFDSHIRTLFATHVFMYYLICPLLYVIRTYQAMQSSKYYEY